MNNLWMFFVACLIGGFISAIVGFSKFRDPFKSRNWFFIGGLAFLLPVVIALILITIDQIKVSISLPGYGHIPFGWIIFEIIVIGALIFACFGNAEDRVARNTTLGCSVFLFIQLLVLIFLFTMIFVFMEPPISRDYDAKINDFGYKEEAGQITITAYLGRDKNAEIPSVIDGKSVTRIAFYAFTENRSITSIVIPDSVETIDQRAFSECYSLTSITIPDSVTSIGDYAFDRCESLTSIAIPDSVTSIGEQAFQNCENLVIQCREDSYAHRYAVENKIEYVLTE
ncbi:MAG: leucine-rich repeat domain-containing protein [Clostridiales bacterium]|nr:leucine-rich repeat domain-containing protein [Clostridiales bacterium]